jgi:tetratricopeptide (TPR) repeat protein
MRPDEMQAALMLAPDDPALLAAVSVAELHAGRLDAALAHAQRLANTAEAQELIGDIQEKRGDYMAAAKAYQSAVELAPDREEYRIRLALEFAEHHTFEPAISILEEAVPIFPKSARIRTLLGITQYADGRIPEAISSLTQAVTTNPSLEPAWNYLSTVVLDSTAAPPPRTVDALCRWNDVVCGAVELRQAREQNDAGLRAQAIEKLRKGAPDNATARCELGRAYQWFVAMAKTADENARRNDAVQAFRFVTK